MPQLAALPDASSRNLWSAVAFRRRAFLEIVPRLCAGAVLAAAFGSPIGWFLRARGVRNHTLAFFTMKPNTAVCFALAAVSLFLLGRNATKGERLWARICALTVVTLGLLTLSEYLSGGNFGIDQLVFRYNLALTDPFPGRMAPGSAANFVLLGAALSAFDFKRRLRTARLLALLVGLASSVVLMGYLYGVSSLYRSGSGTAVANHTALSFMILSIGTLLLAPERGVVAIYVTDTAAGLVARRLLPLSILLPVIFGWLRLTGEREAFYDPAVGVTLMVATMILSFTALTLWIGQALLRMELGRRTAEDSLSRRTDERDLLEQSLSRRTDEINVLEKSLSRSVDERNLLEEQLRHAQKLEAIGSLTSGISHDFNNLLTVIIGYTQLLLSKTAHEHLEGDLLVTIEQAGKRAAALTAQLLAFSRKQASEPQVINLNDSVRNIKNMIERVIGEDIQLTTKLDPRLWSVKADQCQIDQVIMNLAVNARDAMPHGGRLTIETANLGIDSDLRVEGLGVTSGGYVSIVVADNGVGMDKQTLSRIFEPFFTTKEAGRGTGLGLATVRSIIEQTGGQIRVHSEPGNGTAFQIYFPRVEASSERASSAEGSRMSHKGTETVLVVEDDPGVRGLTEAALRMFGYKVVPAENAEDAIKLLNTANEQIDLLLSDVVMPGITGAELAALVALKWPDMKILYMSGYTGDTMTQRGIMQGEIPLLQKPFTPAALAQMVRRVLDSRLELAIAS